MAHLIMKMALLHTSNRWQKSAPSKDQLIGKAKEKANPPAAKNKNAATPFKKGEIFLPTKAASRFISPFLKGVAVPFLMFRMNECCDGMDAKEQLYTAGGFAFSFVFFNKLVFRRSAFCDAATTLTKIGLGIFLCLASFLTQAAIPSETFDSPVQEKQFQTLTEELRCLVCQNESIGDSQAPLAKDLRAEIYKKVKAGESAEAIKAYLVARYGQFILFKPAFNGATYLLWGMPFLLLLCGFLVVGFMVRRSRAVKK